MNGETIAENPPTVKDLPVEVQEKISEAVAEYEVELREQYRREDDKKVIQKKKRSFRQELIERELADENREEEDLRQEEHILISTNLALSLIFLAFFTVFALAAADQMETYAKAFSSFFVKYFSWFYMLISTGSLIFLAYLALSRFGAVVLGDPDDEPEFDDLSWYAMLFSAGMGVGLMFWGAAEPLRHFINPPIGVARTAGAARWAMIYSAFHWGLHGWGIYTLCAVGVAYYGFRKRKKYLLSSSIVDVTDNAFIRKGLKVASDLCSTLAVVFGVACSLGMGVQQIAGGLKHVWKIDAASTTGYVVIMAIITVLYMLSATTGLDKGIKWLSNINVLVAICLMFFVFICGPSLFQLKIFVDTIGAISQRAIFSQLQNRSIYTQLRKLDG